MRSPSTAWLAPSGPRRWKMAGSTLRLEAATCSTTSTAAGNSASSLAITAVSASTPPAEAPRTTRPVGSVSVTRTRPYPSANRALAGERAGYFFFLVPPLGQGYGISMPDQTYDNTNDLESEG